MGGIVFHLTIVIGTVVRVPMAASIAGLRVAEQARLTDPVSQIKELNTEVRTVGIRNN